MEFSLTVAARGVMFILHIPALPAVYLAYPLIRSLPAFSLFRDDSASWSPGNELMSFHSYVSDEGFSMAAMIFFPVCEAANGTVPSLMLILW